jgi:hypothetical protein
MQLAKSIMLKGSKSFAKTFYSVLFFSFSFAAMSQDNSPYSRYGIGNLSPSTNISTRALGGISAAYIDYTGINFSNPASYAAFLSNKEARSNKLESGRAILDIGVNLSNRTLIAPNTPNKFTSSDLLFSYLQLGVPLRQNWGLSFGIRPISRINYRVNKTELLKDAGTGLPIDSAITQFSGSGGSFLPTIGTGFSFKLGESKNAANKRISRLAVGINLGYFFGNRENKALRNLFNDSVLYYASDHNTTSSFGDVFFNSGLQYQFQNRNDSKKQTTIFRLGLSGNWQQKLNASVDSLRQTYTIGNAGEILQIDSVLQKNDIKGEIIYPGSYKAGFVIQRIKDDYSGWLFGVDYSQSKWSNYRYFGKKDSVQDNWELNVGAQINPKPGTNYFSNVTYRFGFFTGPDYIKVGKELPQFGVTFGLGLPIRKYNRQSEQTTLINLAFEYGKRGNNDNLLKENLFRFSVGFNLNDVWFRKRKYD